MSEHPHVALLRRGYQAFAEGDLATLDAIFADDIVWQITGNNPMAGEYKGKPAVFAQFGKLAELTDGTFALDTRDILGGDDRAVALSNASARRDSRTLSGEHVDVFRIVDGRVTGFWSTSLDPYSEDAFWA